MGTVSTTFIGGSRFYQSPDDHSITVPGVTSVLNMFPKGFLGPWNAKLAAELAADMTTEGDLQRMVKRDREGAVTYVKDAAKRYTKQAAEKGSEAHDLFERMIRGEELGPVSTLMEPYVKHFDEFLSAVQPELVSAEDVAWSDTHGYAGSYDAELLVKVDPETGKLDQQGEAIRLMSDWKTGKNTYPDVALQLSAYAYADRVISPDGSTRPMPTFDGGLVVHVTSEKWAAKPARVNEELHGVFLSALAFFHTVRQWEGEGWGRSRISGMKDDVIGKPIAKNAPKRRVTGTERRAK
ncbi:hypothetical protein ACFPA8_07900 [Streptomyces ovatisporus]|uniref:PD-(D/E)XK endonuclease-like domain-containing protein n=1 Tax=Streptomyces ovatisporus TaxID=1128682 RepID=A0ABV9A295_9ACTN